MSASDRGAASVMAIYEGDVVPCDPSPGLRGPRAVTWWWLVPAWSR